MTYRVSLSPQARLDMKESVAYLRSRSPQSARRWYRELKTLQKSLTIFPSRFPTSRINGSSYRVAIHYSHKVIFRIDEQRETVCIVRVYHSARKPLASAEEIEFE